jgi:hypothetical protein
MRTSYAGEVVIDQFSVWNEDGTVKVPGLTVFNSLAWKDGVSQILTVTVTEIGIATGEYMMTFTPATPGFWKVEVTVLDTGDVLASTYDVKKKTYRPRMTAVDDRANIRFAFWVENDDGTRSTGLTSATASIVNSAGTVVVAMGEATPTAGGVFAFLADSEDVPTGAEYIVSLVAVQGTLSWSYNLGFSKVA